MKKYVFTLFVLLTALVAESYAQTKSIEYSTPLESTILTSSSFILTNEQGYYVISLSGYDGTYQVVGFNKARQKVWEHFIKGAGLKFFATSQKLNCFTTRRNSKTKSDDLYVSSINAYGEKEVPKLLVSSYKNEHLNYNIEQSDQGNRFLISRILPPSKKKSSFDVLAVILNEDLNKVGEDLINIPYSFDEFRIQNILFDGKNKIFLQGGRVYGPKTTDRFYHVGFLRNHIIFSYDFNNKNFKETEVKIDVQVTGTPYFRYFNGSIYLVGYHYRNYTQMNSLGTFFLKFDAGNMSQLKSTIEWFDPATKKIPTGKDIGKVGSKTIYLHVEFDAKGNLYIVDNYSLSCKALHLHDDDVAIIKLDENGYIKWVRGISRVKPTLNDPFLPNPYILQTPDKVYVLFADSYKNNALRNTMGENARKNLDNNFESTSLATINYLGDVTYEYITKKGDECKRDFQIVATIFENELIIYVDCPKRIIKMLHYPLK